MDFPGFDIHSSMNSYWMAHLRDIMRVVHELLGVDSGATNKCIVFALDFQGFVGTDKLGKSFMFIAFYCDWKGVGN